MRIRIAGALAALAALTLAACGDGGSHGPPPVPAVLEPAGSGQLATVGTPVEVPPQVRVLTSAGEPVRNVSVTFAVTGGGGSLSGDEQLTDAQGIARALNWTLGTTAGENQVTATAGQLSTVISATGVPGPAAGVVLLTELPETLVSGFVFAPQPVVEVRDAHGNRITTPAVVTASLALGQGTLNGTRTVASVNGVAAFTNLSISGVGEHQLRFTVTGLAPAVSNPTSVAVTTSGRCPDAGGLVLDLALGGTVRRTFTEGSAISCLEFDLAKAAGEQYLVLFEHLPLTGSYDDAVFPGVQFPSSFSVSLALVPATFDPAVPAPAARLAVVAESAPTYAWDFGAGPIYEAQVTRPAGGVPEPRIMQDGRLIALSALVAEPKVGDTLVVFLEGIPRLGITRGPQSAVIRHISPDLVFAEDVRLATTLTRENGNLNTPMTVADMQEIASEYAAFAKVQGDALFGGRHNRQTETGTLGGGRVIAVHTLMFADNIWGYTYSDTDYFAFDYWVATDGSTRSHNQVAQRIADDLFMHEIAHMRHWGLLEHAGRASDASRGNRWLVEGFARFTERLPIAARLLGTQAPSRTGNVELPRNPVFDGRYFFDDVPTYLSAGSSMFDGYAASSFVFDYFADLVAAGGGDHLAAIRDLLLNAGSSETLDAAVSRWVPGTDFGELFTRARVALYADDLGVSGLPADRQYQQFQLRQSRPPGARSNEDPRNAWPKLVPGVPGTFSVNVPRGGAYGYLVDGVAATGSARIDVNASQGTHAVVSVTRIR